jgi:hypothetical protein
MEARMVSGRRAAWWRLPWAQVRSLLSLRAKRNRRLSSDLSLNYKTFTMCLHPGCSEALNAAINLTNTH